MFPGRPLRHDATRRDLASGGVDNRLTRMAVLRRNILLFHQGALGDFVLTWPVAMALARIHPQSRIFYVTQARKGKLAERAIGVESADADAGWHALFGDASTPLPDAPGRLLAGA